MVRQVYALGCVLLSAAVSAREPNYDEAKIAPYALEDPLTFADGTRLTDMKQWPARRAEIVKIFEREMFGRTPPRPEAVVTEMKEEGPTLAGLAIRRQYRMWFTSDRSGPFVDWLVVIPNRINGNEPIIRNGKVVCENTAKVPVVLMLNYRGNQEMLTDPEVSHPEGVWVRDHTERFSFEHKPSRWTRAAARDTQSASPLPIETIVARGYAFVTACYGQISPDVEVRKGDPEDLAYTGVFTLWPKRDPKAADNITAIGAWAWALSRGLDLAETIPEIDAKKSVATGCSRLAKTPILACSRDERFAVCVPCQTGGGVCPLAKRDFGENVSTEMRAFPHWYCRAYGKYVDNEQKMKFDQHLLLASIAPRALLVESFNSDWFDTKGEFLACRAASPAWAFLGKKGLPEGDFPANYDTSMIGPSLGYVRRGGAHGISGSDWQWMLDFADRILKSEYVCPPSVTEPSPKNASLKTAGGPLVQAHRGSRCEYDDNALGAFRWCLEKGIRGFEVDLKYTKDLQIVVMHDTDVARTTDGVGRVEDLTLSEIRKFRLKACSEPVPTLDELLDVLHGRDDIFVEFEMKVAPDDFYGGKGHLWAFCREVREKVEARMAAGTYCFTAWSPFTLMTFRKENPTAPLGIIIVTEMGDVELELAKTLGCCSVAPMLRTTRAMVDKAHAAGMSVCLWPTPDLESYNEAKAKGADRVTTDYAHLLDSAIRGKRKKLVAIDLDATICQHRSAIPTNNLVALQALGAKYKCIMVGGDNAPDIYRQMGDYPIDIGGSTSFDFAGSQYSKYDATLDWAKAHGYTLDDIVFIGDDFANGGGDSDVRIKGMDRLVIDDYRKFSDHVRVLLK